MLFVSIFISYFFMIVLKNDFMSFVFIKVKLTHLILKRVQLLYDIKNKEKKKTSLLTKMILSFVKSYFKDHIC